MIRGSLSLALLFTLLAGAVAEEWPGEARHARIASSADGASQEALFYIPEATGACPLLVALHSWSGDWLQEASIPYLEWCIRKRWVFVHPNFRGPNKTPEAAGSDLVVRDILDAVGFASRAANVDPGRIYLVGVSGGGMAALLLAGRAPEIWAGVSAWVPISNLRDWFSETRERGLRYEGDMLKVLGADPTRDAEAAQEALTRSPITYLAAAQGVPLDINAGITDGHAGSVPISHSLNAFNLLADPRDRISSEAIAFMVKNQAVPEDLQFVGEDPSYGEKRVLLRRESGKARITLFQGGHEILFPAALAWLEQRRKVPLGGSGTGRAATSD